MEEEQILDWEDNTQNLPFYKHMIAGSLAGVAEHAVSFPFDTLRTYAQAESTQLSSFSGSLSLIRRLGFIEMWKGVTTVFYGCIPAHALYFSVYEISKKYFKIETNSNWYFYSTSLTGAMATVVHDSIMTPMDGIFYLVVKQRIQLTRELTPLTMLRHLIRTEGAWSLYKSLPITIAMNIPQSALFMTFYENLKSMLYPDGKVSMSGYFYCAGLAGSISAGLTTPFDVIKTRLQTQHEESKVLRNEEACNKVGKNKNEVGHRYVGVRSTFEYIWKNEGAAGFFRGLAPRMMIFLPGAAISWSSYEYIKKILG